MVNILMFMLVLGFRRYYFDPIESYINGYFGTGTKRIKYV